MKTKKGRKSMYSKSSKPKDTLNMAKVSKIVSKNIHRSFILAKADESKETPTGKNCIEAAKNLAKSLAATEEGALVLALDDALRAAGYFGTKEHQLASKAYGKLTEGRQLLDELVTAIESDMEEKASLKEEQKNFTKELPSSTSDTLDKELEDAEDLDGELEASDLDEELKVSNKTKKKIKPKHPGTKVSEKRVMR